MIKNKKQQLIYLAVASHSESTMTVMLLGAYPDSPYSLKLQQRNADCVSESDLKHFYDTASGYHYSLSYVK
ncbi:hypothetical protein AKG98_3684 [Moritella sp. JT01]|uniref:hypothetical protein n=1 Tax=Moritella sp. JT01 TaxID=756698 RepID=UPI0007912F8F|nr:hypothetical protein [Moritella sp. JT01]KXO12491.1 hypothetical protein AKG98_3684 [Moritella sp. JT01]